MNAGRIAGAMVAAGLLASALTARADPPADAPAEVREWMDLARSRTSQKRLDEAADALQRAIDLLQGDYPAAEENLRNVRAEIARADRAYRSAAASADSGQLEKALVEVSAALTIFPGQPGAGALDHRLRSDLSAARTDAGAAALHAGKPGQAEKLYREAMRYRPDYPPARQGLAQVFGARGALAARQGRHGAALLWYRQAAKMSGLLAFGDEFTAEQAAVRRRIGYDLAVTSDGEGGPAAGAAIVAQLVRRKPPHAAIAARPGQETPYVLHAVVQARDVRKTQIGSETREHLYLAQELGPNPRLGDLSRAIVDAQRRLAWMQRIYDLQNLPPSDDGARRPPRQRERIDIHDLRRQALLVSRLKNELFNTPRQAPRDVAGRWAFRLETWQIQATLQMQIQILTAGRIVETFEVANAATQTDQTIDRPNPAIGLPEDPLELVSPQDISAELLTASAAEATDKAIAVIEERHAQHIRGVADARQQAGDTVGALESRVDAAMLVAGSDPNAAEKTLDALTAAMQR